MTAVIPAPRKPVHCLRHPGYWLASCTDCRAAQHAEVAKR